MSTKKQPRVYLWVTAEQKAYIDRHSLPINRSRDINRIVEPYVRFTVPRTGHYLADHPKMARAIVAFMRSYSHERHIYGNRCYRYSISCPFDLHGLAAGTFYRTAILYAMKAEAKRNQLAILGGATIDESQEICYTI